MRSFHCEIHIEAETTFGVVTYGFKGLFGFQEIRFAIACYSPLLTPYRASFPTPDPVAIGDWSMVKGNRCITRVRNHEE